MEGLVDWPGLALGLEFHGHAEKMARIFHGWSPKADHPLLTQLFPLHWLGSFTADSLLTVTPALESSPHPGLTQECEPMAEWLRGSRLSPLFVPQPRALLPYAIGLRAVLLCFGKGGGCNGKVPRGS